MGIITKEVEIRPTGKMIKYYRDKGYDAKYQTPLMVKVEDLLKSSHAIIEVLCDYCKESIVTTTYDAYNRSLKNIEKYACKKCSYLKYEDVCRLKYGVSNYGKTNECHEKMKNTMIKKYGVEHNSQLPDYLDKYHITCINRYGENYKQQFAEKAFNSFFEKTGYASPSQSPDVKRKIVQSIIDNYGVDNPGKSIEIREKITKTLYQNSSQKASRQQRYICNLYHGILNFPVKYYNCDIYLPEDNLIVEYDGGFHMGNVITGRETEEEHNQKEIVRFNVIKREGYKQMRIISTTDKLPSDEVLFQLLSHAKEYFSNYPERSWIEFNIDTSTVRNAEHGEVFFDYGKLRRIKKSDLPDETTILETA